MMKIHLTRSRIVFSFFILLLVGLCSCACMPDPVDPQPSADLRELVTRTVHHWLDMRVMGQEDVDKVQSLTASWRSMTNIPTFVTATELTDLGDPQAIFDQIKGSEVYRCDPPTDDDLLDFVKRDIDSFTLDLEE